MTLESFRIVPSRRSAPGLFLPFLALQCILFAVGVIEAPRASAQRSHQERDFGRVPLSFEANRGQVDPRVKFVSRGAGYALFLTGNEAVIEIQKQSASKDKLAVAVPSPLPISTLRMQLKGANVASQVSGVDTLPGTANYFVGTDPKKWQTAVPTYKRVNYQAVYPGVDLVYYGNQRELEYDFVVAAGADPGKIALGFKGATPKLDRATGDLILALSSGETRFHKPDVYQMNGDREVAVEGGYTVAKNEVRFSLGSYDHTKPLVIDPVLSYLTYLGGNMDDQLSGIAVDSSGSAYVMGTTTSLNFPLANAYQGTDPGGTNGNRAMFVTKFNSTGTALVYSTYLGGMGNTFGFGIAVDNGGSAYVVGYVDTNGYPVTNGAFQTLCGGARDGNGNRVNGCTGAGQGDDSGVLSKLSPDGQSLAYSTYLSGDNFNAIIAVAVNAAGEAYVTGITNAHCGKPPYSNSGYLLFQCFPTTAGTAQDPTDIGGGGTHTTGFFTKFNAAGSALIYSSILGIDQAGPQGTTNPYGVAIDPAGNGYITGYSTYTLLTTPGSYKPTYTGAGRQAFVAKFDPAAQALIYSTFVGGTTNFSSQAQGIAVDAPGNAYIAGLTTDCGFPTTPGAFQTQAAFPPGTAANCTAGFVTKLNPAGSGLVWSTFLGDRAGTNDGNGYLNAIALGSDDSVYVAGYVQGGTFPSANPVLPQGNFAAPAVVSRLSPDGSALLFSSTIGSPTSCCSEPATGIALDPSDNIYVAGIANGTTALPTTPGAFQGAPSNANNGQSNDGWVAKIAPFGVSTTTLTLSSTSVNAGQAVTLTATVAGQAGSPVPTGTVTFLNGSTTLGTGTLDSTGTATYTTSMLGATTYMLSASYGGDTYYSASTSAAQTLVVNPISTTTALTINPSRVVAGASVSLMAKVIPALGTGIPTGTVTFTNGSTQLAAVALDSTGAATFTSSTLPVGNYSITAAYSGDTTYSSSTGSAPITVIVAGGSAGLQFIPVTPCRVADTRNAAGAFGGPALGAGTTRTFDIPQSSCGIPTSAVAYSLNVTVVPPGSLNYLTLYPTGVPQPYVSTLNSDGRVKANAAITPAGTNGGVDIFVSDATHVILDIDGYFVPAGTASALAFYPVTPCRVSDTRSAAGPLGGPFIAGNTHRDFPVQSSNCLIPANAQAYSLNVTAIPHTTLNYLTAWATGQTQPYVSTLNSTTGAIAANAAIVPTNNGYASIFVSDDADVILDVNGYFAPPTTGGLSLYTTTPCRIVDTRSGAGAFNGVISVAAQASACAPPAAAQAYVLNATVVPSGPLTYLTLWPNGQTQPYVSTLNAIDGAITSNMAIVPNVNGSIDVFSSDPTNVILDISSYFAP